MSKESTSLEDGDRAAAAGDWGRAVDGWIESDLSKSSEARQRLRWLLNQVDGEGTRRPAPLPRLPLVVTGVAIVVVAGLLTAGYRSTSWWRAVPIWIVIAVAAGGAIWFAMRAGSQRTQPLTQDEIARAREVASNLVPATKHEHHPS